jgi:hypothetical protein
VRRGDTVVDEPPRWMTPREISESVAAGHYVPEREFDRYLPEGLRQLSALQRGGGRVDP